MSDRDTSSNTGGEEMSDREGYLKRRDQLLMQDERIAELEVENHRLQTEAIEEWEAGIGEPMITGFEKRELGYIQSLRELESRVVVAELEQAAKDDYNRYEDSIVKLEAEGTENEAQIRADMKATRILKSQNAKLEKKVVAVQAVLDEADADDEWVPKWKIAAALEVRDES